MSTYNKIDPKFKAKWLRALRGRTFKQTRGELIYYNNRAHCCIAVGAAVKEGKKPGQMLSLPETNACGKSFGLRQKAINRLVDMNDKKNYTFKQIADWIERCL